MRPISEDTVASAPRDLFAAIKKKLCTHLARKNHLYEEQVATT